MTPQEIVSRLCDPRDSRRGVSVPRIEKARGAALRAKLEWAEVLAAMTDEQRKQVSDAQGS